MVKISVHTPVYNASEHLAECLDSILSQTLSDFEVICVNDGSTDDSLDILNAYARKDARIKVFDQGKNTGTLQARKRIFEEATGEYMAFIDADDLAQPEMLEELYEKAIETDSDFVQCGATILDKDNALSKDIFEQYNSYFSNVTRFAATGEDIFQAYGKKIKNNFWVSLFKRDVYKTIIPHIPDAPIPHGNDNILIFMLMFFSKNYTSLNKNLYLYRASGTTSNLTIPSPEKAAAHIVSRGRVIELAQDFLLTQNPEHDLSQLPFPTLKNNTFAYTVRLMDRCLKTHPEKKSDSTPS